MSGESALFVTATTSVGGGDGYLYQYKWTGSLSQQWSLYQLTGQFYALTNIQTGLVMTDPNTTSAAGLPLTQSQWNGKFNQWWYLYLVRK